jgi:hypothetical protein
MRVILPLTSLAIAGVAFAAEPVKVDPAVAAATAKYDVAVKAADEAREKALAGPREALLKELQVALATAMKNNDLASANKINDTISKYKTDAAPADGVAKRFIGQWGETTVTADGKVKHDGSGKMATWTVQGNKIVMKWQDGVVEVGEFREFLFTTVNGAPRAKWFHKD